MTVNVNLILDSLKLTKMAGICFKKTSVQWKQSVLSQDKYSELSYTPWTLYVAPLTGKPPVPARPKQLLRITHTYDYANNCTDIKH